MNPYTGEVFELPEGFAPDAEIGDTLDREQIRDEVATLANEFAKRNLPLLEQRALTLVSGEAAQRAKLGAREQERRRKRRKSGKAARRRNR